jgi:hypothetical protein
VQLIAQGGVFPDDRLPTALGGVERQQQLAVQLAIQGFHWQQ